MTAILDKIRKLRALSTSSNVHEAAAAAAAAERLIQEHNLSEAELSVDEEDEHVTYEGVADLGGRIATWQSNLLYHLSRAYQCSGYYKTFYPEGAKTAANRYVAYGRPQDLETLKYQFAYFSAEITRLSLQWRGTGSGRTWLNSFRLGAVQAIGAALSETRSAARKTATSSALVVVDRRADLAKSRRDQDHPDLRSTSSRSSAIDGDGFAAGQRAGAGINQRSAIGAGGTRLLGK